MYCSRTRIGVSNLKIFQELWVTKPVARHGSLLEGGRSAPFRAWVVIPSPGEYKVAKVKSVESMKKKKGRGNPCGTTVRDGTDLSRGDIPSVPGSRRVQLV